MNTPIDRTDPSTYDGEIETNNEGLYHNYSTNSFPFVEGTQYHFAIYFYDVSRAEYSLKAVTTDPVVVPASYENLTVDNVTVVRGWITNDNQTTFDRLVTTDDTPKYVITNL